MDGGVFLFLTYFMQQTLDLSPLTTGVAFLPMSMVLVLTSTTVQTQVLQHTGVRPLVITGMSLGLIAMLLLTRLTPSSTYASNILPALIILGVGVGCIFAPAFSTATLGVATHEAGIASAMVNTSQQIGGSARCSPVRRPAMPQAMRTSPGWPERPWSTVTRPPSGGRAASSRSGCCLRCSSFPRRAGLEPRRFPSRSVPSSLAADGHALSRCCL